MWRLLFYWSRRNKCRVQKPPPFQNILFVWDLVLILKYPKEKRNWNEGFLFTEFDNELLFIPESKHNFWKQFQFIVFLLCFSQISIILPCLFFLLSPCMVFRNVKASLHTGKLPRTKKDWKLNTTNNLHSQKNEMAYLNKTEKYIFPNILLFLK